MNRAVIVGTDHHNTLGLVESLAEKNVMPYVILHTQHSDGYVLHSKYIIKGWCCPDESAIIKCLLDNFKDKTNKTVILTTSDNVADIIDRNSGILDQYFYLSTTHPYGNLANWMSKEKMSETAREVGLNVPTTWLLNNDKIPKDITYPVITKAISSIEGTKANISVCRCEKDLELFLKKQHCKTIQIQKFIDKEFEFQLIGCSLNEGSTVFIPGRTHIDRPNGMDNTFFLRFDKCEEEFDSTIEKAKAFVKITRYTGPFSIEFLKDKNDGKFYFTEMNFRNDGNAYCVTASGTNIPYILFLAMTGGNYMREIEKSTVKTTYLCPEVYYFTCLLKREFGGAEWLRNMKKTTCYTTLHKNDIMPFLWFIWLAIKKRICKL